LTKHLLESISKPLDQTTVDDLRAYLSRFQDRNCNTRANLLKSIKIFFRDFLKRPDLVESFKFPKRPFVPKSVLGRVDLMKFFDALETDRDKLLFLLFASSGLRRSEILSLTIADLDLENRAIVPRNHETGKTKNSWISFYNLETEPYLKNYLAGRAEANDKRLFPFGEIVIRRAFKKATLKSGVRITPQVLRFWFANEMSRLGMSDRIIDALQGRTPRSILARRARGIRLECARV